MKGTRELILTLKSLVESSCISSKSTTIGRLGILGVASELSDPLPLERFSEDMEMS